MAYSTNRNFTTGSAGVTTVGTLDGEPGGPSANGATIASTTIFMQTANANATGLLSSGDWSRFNATVAGSGFNAIGAIDSLAASPKGLTSSAQTIFAQSASSSNPGMVTSAAQTFAGTKTFNTSPNLSSLTASLPLRLDGSKNIINGSTSLTAEVVGVLPIANGGTNSAAGLNNARIIVSSAGSIVELHSISASLPMRTDAAGLPTVGSTSLTSEVVGNLPLSQTSGSISLTNQVSGNLPLSQTSGSISLTNQVSGVLPVTSGGTGTFSVFAAGSVIFADGAGRYNQNNAGFLFNTGSVSLGLGTSSPNYPLHVQNPSTTSSGLAVFTTNDFLLNSGGSALYIFSSANSGNTNFGIQAYGQGITGSVFQSLYLNPYGGDIGFGTTTTKLDTNATIGNRYAFDGGPSLPWAEVYVGANNSGTANYIGAISFYNSNSSGTNKRIHSIFCQNEGAINNGSLQFWTYNSAGGSSERLRISSGGNVGIGVSTPSSLLQVQGNIKCPSLTVGSVTYNSSAGGNAYTLNFPGVQASSSSQLLNDGLGNLSWIRAAGNLQTFTTTGSSTYTPTQGMTSVVVFLMGCGGNGGAGGNSANGGAGGGGGGGGELRLGFFSAQSLTSTVTVGLTAAGTAGSSTFGTFLSASGGVTGGNAAAQTFGGGGLGGLGGTGGIGFAGSAGDNGQQNGGTAIGNDPGANGAPGIFGSGAGRGGAQGAGGGNAGSNTGAGGGGGGGANGSSPAGGNGAVGVCVVLEYF